MYKFKSGLVRSRRNSDLRSINIGFQRFFSPPAKLFKINYTGKFSFLPIFIVFFILERLKALMGRSSIKV